MTAIQPRHPSAEDSHAGNMPENLELTAHEFTCFQRWLYDTAGIQLTEAKRTLVAGRLNKRVRALNLRSYGAYFEFIQQNKNSEAQTERQNALDLLTTNETYFFRESAHFDFIRKKLLPQWRNHSVHCWSAASSTGQEAYSLAMLLATHHTGTWRITGTDISSRVIHTAQQGTYPLSQSEKIPLEYLQEHCRKGINDKAGTFRIALPVRQNVQFQQANLQQSQGSLGPFDLILLRNVMIYFDATVKKKVLDNVLNRLKPGGLLFIGHAESLNGITTSLHMVQPAIYQAQH